LGQQLTGLNQYPYQKSLEAFVESLIIVCDHAKKNGVELLIENNVVARKNLVNGENKLLLGATAEDLLEILSSVGSRSLGLLIDTGHLKVTANAMSFDPLGFLDDLRQHIRAFHLSENDGTEDQNSAVGKHSWFLPIVKSFRDALFVLEAYNLTVQETRDSISLLEVAI
jgi:sugar phosphate isomerase/epimerase